MNVHEVSFWTPYRRNRVLVLEDCEKVYREWLFNSLMEYCADNVEDAIEEWRPRDENEEFFESELYDWYIRESDFSESVYTDKIEPDDEVINLTENIFDFS